MTAASSALEAAVARAFPTALVVGDGHGDLLIPNEDAGTLLVAIHGALAAVARLEAALAEALATDWNGVRRQAESERDEACGRVARLEAENTRLRDLTDALAQDTRVLITDYYSGLPEDAKPVMGAVARLDELLNDDDGKPRAALGLEGSE